MDLFRVVPVEPPLAALALVTAVIAAYCDLRWRRIPNWLTGASLVAGIAGNLLVFGTPGIVRAAGGFAVAALLYGALYALRGVGAGDVKLMMAMGVAFGARNWALLALLAACVSACAGLAISMTKGRLRQTLLNAGLLVTELAAFRRPHLATEELDVGSAKAIRFPHGVAVALGTAALAALAVPGRPV